MVLLDSNVVIYSTQAESEFDALREYLLANTYSVSLITYVEVLGFHKINKEDKASLDIFFEATPILAITTEIAARAVELRQKRNMNLGDALIAATAIENNLALVTRNTKDFKWIDSLTIIDPLTNS